MNWVVKFLCKDDQFEKNETRQAIEPASLGIPTVEMKTY